MQYLYASAQQLEALKAAPEESWLGDVEVRPAFMGRALVRRGSELSRDRLLERVHL